MSGNPIPKMSELELQNEAVTAVKQSGTHTKFGILSRIPNSSLNTLKSLNLQYLDIYTPLLLQILRKATHLKILHILNCELSEPLIERVTLPSLTDFILGLKMSDLTDVQTIDQSKFHSLIFFDKKEPWDIKNIWLLSTNIELRINGDIIFKVHHQLAVFSSRLTFTNEISKFLTQKETNVVRLFKLFCKIDLDFIPQNIIQLGLSDIKVEASEIQSILDRCKHIQTLKLHFNELSPIPLVPIFELECITNLCLSGVQINYVPLVFTLKTLHLENFSLCPKTTDMFNDMFKAEQLRLVWPRLLSESRAVTISRFRFVENILQNIETTLICIRNIGYYWSQCDRIYNKDLKCNLNCGGYCVAVSEKMEHYSKKFMLQGIFSACFVIERKDKWKAKKLEMDGQNMIEESIVSTFEP